MIIHSISLVKTEKKIEYELIDI